MENLCMFLRSGDKITTRMTIASSLPFFLGRFIDRTAWMIPRSKKHYKLMARLVVNFPNISYLIIEDSASPQTATDMVVMNSYTACASNLQKLSLVIKSADFNAFPPNASELKSIEEVDLTFSPLSESTAFPKAAPAFLLAIASRLTTLKLNLLFCDTDIDKILQSFPPGRAVFPKLTSFSLSHAASPAAPSSDLTHFLNQHADTLKHLSLQFTKPPPFTSQSFDDLGNPVDPMIVLPHIETLNFASSSLSCNLTSHEGLDAVRAYAQHIGSTLTGLGLWHCLFTLQDLGILLDLLTQGSGGSKRLFVAVEAFSPQMLDILAEKLPQLEELMVNFDFLRSCDVPGATISTDVDHSRGLENLEPFLLEMEMRYYQKWSLRSLAIDHDPRRTRTDPEMATRFLLGLARCMPDLVEINGPSLLWKRRGLEYAWTKYDYEE